MCNPNPVVCDTYLTRWKSPFAHEVIKLRNRNSIMHKCKYLPWPSWTTTRRHYRCFHIKRRIHLISQEFSLFFWVIFFPKPGSTDISTFIYIVLQACRLGDERQYSMVVLQHKTLWPVCRFVFSSLRYLLYLLFIHTLRHTNIHIYKELHMHT